MAEGHKDSSGKFHPHTDDSKSGVSSDQVKDEPRDESVNVSDAEKIKKQKS